MAFHAIDAFSQSNNRRPHFRRMAYATDTLMAHDPVMAYEAPRPGQRRVSSSGTYYLLSTGVGLQWATSSDLKTWVVLKK
jgi:arabinan endo-1,5-alpha-L-arabinosidase